MEKKHRFIKYKNSFDRVNETKTTVESQVSPKHCFSTSKILTKETDPCELSVNYTNDYADLYSSEILQASARNSLIDLRCEAQMYLDSSRRAAKKKSKESFYDKNSQLAQVIQIMHESMKTMKEKLETVDKKYEKSENLNRELKESVLDLKETVKELKMNKDCECVNKCVIV